MALAQSAKSTFLYAVHILNGEVRIVFHFLIHCISMPSTVAWERIFQFTVPRGKTKIILYIYRLEVCLTW